MLTMAGRIAEIKKKFPEWMLSMDRGFLREVQHLHDNDKFWSDKGLTEYGKRYVEQIKGEYSKHLAEE